MKKTADPIDQGFKIGPYRIVDVLGEGGMAVVYRAEQTEPMKRQVALKILKLGMDTKQVVARFESERQALAVMDHPNIEKVFDGGALESGRPYFVMELVRGVPITEYCDTHKLTTPERLTLFIDVCSAVQHAHHKGVIHRDIKPAHILVGVVGNRPQAKVIDFGIAKAVGGKLTDKPLVTRIGQFIGTPQYMSPEQADLTGLDVDTRTDIYSLGVVLYELLVGAPPLDLSAVSDQAMLYALREREPSKPSTRLTELGDALDEVAAARRTDTATLRRDLQGDLDWVVMKAMSKDRTRRYETVNALSMECDRVLQHEPVLARPPSAGYLFRRFIQRNRIGVSAAAVALLAIIAGATMTTIGMVRAIEAQRQAEAARNSTNRVVDAMIDMIGDTYSSLIRTSESLRSSETAGVLQNEPLRYVLNRTEMMVGRTLVDQPDAGVRILRLQGTTNQVLGRFAESELLLQSALAQAREAGLEAEQVQLLLDLAEVSQTTSKAAEAQDYLKQARALDAFAEAEPELRAEANLIAGEVELLASAYAQAREFYAEAIDILEREPKVTTQLASAYWLMADAWLLQERIPESLPWLQKSIDIFVELEGADYHGLQRPFSSFGWAQQATGNYTAALENFQRALNVVDRNFGTEHRSAAVETNNIAMALNRLGRYDEAVESYEKAIALWQRVAPASDQYRLAGYYSNLGNANANRGEMALATRNYEDGLRTVALNDPPDARMLAYLQNNLGRHLYDLGETERSIELLEKAIQRKAEVFGPDNVSTARSKISLAKVFIREGRFEKASALVSDAAIVYEDTYADKPHMLAFLLEAQASLEFAQGQLESARDLLMDAHSRRIEGYAAAPAQTAETKVSIARVLAAQGLKGEALSWLAEAEAVIAGLTTANPLWIEATLLGAELNNGQAGDAIVTDLRQSLYDQYPSRTDWIARLEAITE